ncbi:MAG: hypothetical protein HYZ26_11015 [Chloroflexi bacterium]|nr:hypothetical protein [Chloroflexota bacterium]
MTIGGGLVAQTEHSFIEALGGAAPSVRQFRIAGFHIRLEFASPVLVPFLYSAFQHLAEPPTAQADLIIHIWDSQSTGAPPPPLPTFDRDEVWILKTSRLQAYTVTPGRSFYLLNFGQGRAYYWLAAPDLWQPEISSPIIPILHWWLLEQGWAFLHAAAVGVQELGAALLVGRGGRGKSSTALACLKSHLLLLGDDYCLARQDGSLHSLFSSAKLDDASLVRFPYLESARSPFSAPDWEKHLFFLYPAFRENLSAELSARCILLPSVTSGPDTFFRPARPAQALAALAPSTLYQLRFTREADRMLAMMRSLTDNLPCFTLHLGQDQEKIPQAIEEVLRQCA